MGKYEDNLELIKKAVRCEPVDWVPFVPCANAYMARANGIQMKEYINNFEVACEANLKEHTKDHMVVHRDHRLADAGKAALSGFSEDTLIMVSPDDSMESPRLILDACKTAGFTPKVRYASSLSEEMLLVEAGLGVCILDSRNTLSMNNNPSVRFLDIPTISDPSLTMAWHSQHYNPMKDVFIQHFHN